jgi:hypothetical protein
MTLLLVPASSGDAVKAGELDVERLTLICLGFEWRTEGDNNRNANRAGPCAMIALVFPKGRAFTLALGTSSKGRTARACFANPPISPNEAARRPASGN